jgi:hypothetical protein
LELTDSIYSASFVSMMTNKSFVPPKPMKDLKKITSLFATTQIVFGFQLVIIILLAHANLKDPEAFYKPTPTYIMMRMITAFLFHIMALEDAREAYIRQKFLVRYPNRIEPQLRFSCFMLNIEQFFITILVELFNLMFLCK